MSLSNLATGISAVLKYIGIEATCAVTDDYDTVMIARNVELRDQPKAQFMLDYYVTGKGKINDVEVDTAVLFKEDKGVRDKFWTKYKEASLRNAKSGSVAIEQKNYENREWKNSLGAINLQWRIYKDNVEIWFTNRYRWHPKEDRITQCLHQAAENLKESHGSADFQMNGSHTFFPVPIK